MTVPPPINSGVAHLVNSPPPSPNNTQKSPFSPDLIRSMLKFLPQEMRAMAFDRHTQHIVKNHFYDPSPLFSLWIGTPSAAKAEYLSQLIEALCQNENIDKSLVFNLITTNLDVLQEDNKIFQKILMKKLYKKLRDFPPDIGLKIYAYLEESSVRKSVLTGDDEAHLKLKRLEYLDAWNRKHTFSKDTLHRFIALYIKALDIDPLPTQALGNFNRFLEKCEQLDSDLMFTLADKMENEKVRLALKSKIFEALRRRSIEDIQEFRDALIIFEAQLVTFLRHTAHSDSSLSPVLSNLIAFRIKMGWIEPTDTSNVFFLATQHRREDVFDGEVVFDRAYVTELIGFVACAINVKNFAVAEAFSNEARNEILQKRNKATADIEHNSLLELIRLDLEINPTKALQTFESLQIPSEITKNFRKTILRLVDAAINDNQPEKAIQLVNSITNSTPNQSLIQLDILAKRMRIDPEATWEEISKLKLKDERHNVDIPLLALIARSELMRVNKPREAEQAFQMAVESCKQLHAGRLYALLTNRMGVDPVNTWEFIKTLSASGNEFDALDQTSLLFMACLNLVKAGRPTEAKEAFKLAYKIRDSLLRDTCSLLTDIHSLLYRVVLMLDPLFLMEVLRELNFSQNGIRVFLLSEVGHSYYRSKNNQPTYNLETPGLTHYK